MPAKRRERRYTMWRYGYTANGAEYFAKVYE